jgi:hypothetical protein
MKTVINDIVLFIKKFWSIIGGWIMAVIFKYKFKNALMLAIALVFFFGFHGKFWAHLGFMTLYIWIGINIEQILSVYRELKEKNDW